MGKQRKKKATPPKVVGPGGKFGFLINIPDSPEEVLEELKRRQVEKVVIYNQPHLVAQWEKEPFLLFHLKKDGTPDMDHYPIPIPPLSPKLLLLLYYQYRRIENLTVWRGPLRKEMLLVKRGGLNFSRQPSRIRKPPTQVGGEFLFSLGRSRYRELFQLSEKGAIFLFRFLYYGFHLPFTGGREVPLYERQLFISLLKELILNYPPLRQDEDLVKGGPGGFSPEYLKMSLRLALSHYRWSKPTVLYSVWELLDDELELFGVWLITG